MAILEELISPLSLKDFYDEYLFKAPFAAPYKAERFRNLISWDLLHEIFASGHADCWLPKHGQLPMDPSQATGRLAPEMARRGFDEGRTVLVRHAENAHPRLAEIAADFQRTLLDPIDIQIYCTPGGEEGFDWHYDAEEVFVIQSAGEKEFRLRPNTINPWPVHSQFPKDLHFEKERPVPEIRCHLKAGDWLYIPAGYWHKARALTPSFHLSVGVMALTALGYLESILPTLAKDVMWRQRFPKGEGAIDHSQILSVLNESLSRVFFDESRLRALTTPSGERQTERV